MSLLRVLDRLTSPTPRVIKKLQKLGTFIGLLLTGVSTYINQFDPAHVPTWLPVAVGIGTVFNVAFLQLFTEEDNK